MSKKKPDRYGVVYSTDPGYSYQPESEDQAPTPAPARQKLRVMVDRKQRGGKEVTVVSGFSGQSDDLDQLGRLLKNKCGTGGSVKDGLILIQGNQRDKLVKLLVEMGYTDTKAAGG